MATRPWVTVIQKLIGVVGLLWFLSFVYDAAYIVLAPADAQRTSGVQWTAFEGRFAAMCFIVMGVAGLIPARRYLLLPMLERERAGQSRL